MAYLSNYTYLSTKPLINICSIYFSLDFVKQQKYHLIVNSLHKLLDGWYSIYRVQQEIWFSEISTYLHRK